MICLFFIHSDHINFHTLLLLQWEHIGGKLKWISSGKDIVLGVNSNDDIFFRHGISAGTPAGTGWTHLGGKLSQIDTYGTTVLGVNSGRNAYQLSFKETASMLQIKSSQLPNSAKIYFSASLHYNLVLD